ncbi:MAG: MarR family winged helix-turn-helix transcriptional regulator [Spirochaetia bacterium]|nr:MarR family winged helix-turn-helix transcriptional regulator [Spirochaetia bacterium]
MREQCASRELRKLSNHLRRRLMTFRTEYSETTQTSSHFYIINFIDSKGDTPVYQRDIDTMFSLRRPTTTEILKLMEKNGLVKKERVSSDKRLKRVVITEKAKKMDMEFDIFLEQLENDLTKNLSDEEMQIFFKVIEQMRKNLVETEKS